MEAYYEPIHPTHPFKVFGPFGGDRGDPWDDGRHIDIQRIVVQYDGSFIHSAAFDYVDGNGSIRSIRHGGSGGEETFEVGSRLISFHIFLFYLTVISLLFWLTIALIDDRIMNLDP